MAHLIQSDGKQTSGCFEPEVGYGDCLGKGARESFQGDGSALFLDCGSACGQIYICHNSSNDTFKMSMFYCS